ncbi:HAD family hydrolase [Spirochaeta cellobiosiphila]|uniref:HAD family hydrolase n=1 Tax=Spirochaeta cellobiosiphila TaxID=504483 RepID=UPI0003FEDA0C|nr:HAD family phosphatase [Spirochaeta cellobiosiphila]
MKLKYKAILIDHDDTAVDSTPHIHYLAHIEQMKRFNREEQILSLDEWFQINYSPGLRPYYDNILKLTAQEEAQFHEVWREFTTKLNPPFFPGILNTLSEARQLGAKIIVVSHSEEDIITRHYKVQQDIPGFLPDMIIGWTGDRSKNKPYPWPVEKIEQEFLIDRNEMIIIDDLKPGIVMAQTTGIDSFGVGWSHKIPELMEDMHTSATYYGQSIEELRSVLFN